MFPTPQYMRADICTLLHNVSTAVALGLEITFLIKLGREISGQTLRSPLSMCLCGIELLDEECGCASLQPCGRGAVL